jgi:GT2 family glycosyltransferase
MDRPSALKRCINSVLSQTYENFEVLILDNSSQISTCEKLAGLISDERVQCTHEDEPYGVAGSRNWLMGKASGDIYIVIDDDARFESDDALNEIVAGFHDDVGIQAFKIVDHPDAESERILAPVSQSQADKIDFDESFRASYYVGAGHAIKREVIETCGFYSNDLMYGSEELDLSYRVIDSGFTIEYNPAVVVHHYPEPPVISEETTGHAEVYYRVANRIYIAYRYLPIKYVPSFLLVWLAYFFAQAVRDNNIHHCVSGVRRGVQIARSEPRSPIDKRAERYLKRNHGRLWY